MSSTISFIFENLESKIRVGFPTQLQYFKSLVQVQTLQDDLHLHTKAIGGQMQVVEFQR